MPYQLLRKLFIPLSLVILLALAAPLVKSQTANIDSINVQYSVQGSSISSACAGGFCLIGFTDVSDVRRAKLIFFGSSILTDVLNVPANSLVLREGKTNILASILDTNSMIKNYIIDSSGISKTLQESSPNIASKIEAAYDPVNNRFLVVYQFSNSTTSTKDINGFLIDASTGIKVGDDFNIIKDVWSIMSADYDKSKNKFTVGYVKFADNQYPLYFASKDIGQQPAIQPTAPLLILNAYNTISSIHKDSDNSNIITAFDNSGIQMAKFAVSDSGAIIKKDTKFRPLTNTLLTSNAISFDPINNRLVLVYDKGDATRKDAYIQLVDSISLDNLGTAAQFDTVNNINSPSVNYLDSLGVHIIAYANKATGTVQAKFIDSSGKIVSFKSYTGPSGPASQYDVTDQTTKNKLTTGYRGYKDSIVLFKHPVYGERLLATLEFSKTNPNLSNLNIDATENSTAVNKNSVSGLGQNVFLIVPNKNNWAGIRACPTATKTQEISVGCSGEIIFRGPNFPQTNGSVTASTSVIDQKEVYGVSGMTGSGITLLEESPAIPSKQKLKANLSASFDYGQNNSTIIVSGNYTFNSTIPITGASCAISYSDELLQQHLMTFSLNSYKYSRIFASSPSDTSFTVFCSHENYTLEFLTARLIKNQTNIQTAPTVTLLEPGGQQSSSTVDFYCTVAGQNVKEVSLYTNTSAGFWKKEETKQVTQSTSTIKFELKNLLNGAYVWNCEAKTSSGILSFAPQKKFFKVETSSASPIPTESEIPPTCNPIADCTDWHPDDCPQSQKQIRTCNNTDTCAYPETKSCIYIITSNTTQSNATQSPVTIKNKEGIDIWMIVLIVVIIVLVLAFIAIKRKSPASMDEDVYPEDSYQEEGGSPDEGQDRYDEGGSETDKL